jgi:hypothetical protein
MPENVNQFMLWTPYINLILGFIFGLIATIIGIIVTHKIQSKAGKKLKRHQLYAELIALHKALIEITMHSATVQINCDYYNSWGDLLLPDDPRQREVSEHLRNWVQFSFQAELTRIKIYTQFYEIIVAIRTTFPFTGELKEHVKKCYSITPLDMSDTSLQQINNHDNLDEWLRTKDEEIRDTVREQISRPISELITYLEKYTY